MFWGCIQRNGKRKFVKVDMSINSENYISLLRSNLLQHYKDERSLACISSFPRVTCIKMFLADEYVQPFENWTSQIPDINILEQMCCELLKRIYRQKKKTARYFGLLLKKCGKI